MDLGGSGVRRIRRCVVSAASLFATAILAAPAHAGSGAPPPEAAESFLATALERLAEIPEGPPGASALVQRRGKSSFVRAGIADLRTGRAFHRSDHMRIASTAKAFSGAVILSLVDEGVIGVDDTIGELLSGQPAAWSQVTVAQLMQHTSGVPDFTRDPDFIARFSADPRGYFAPEELPAYVADEPLNFVPGTEYEYSNTDNILLGLIAEAATGRIYPNDLRQLVYRPLGLTQTSLPSDWLLPRRFIQGYDAPGGGAPPEDLSEIASASGAWASGGMVSTPVDMNRFIRGYVAGTLFGGDARKRQFTFIAGSSEPMGPGVNRVGLSLFEYSTRCGTVFGHTGNTFGYTQFMAATRNGRRSAVVSMNQQVSEATLQDFRGAAEAAVCFALSRGA